MVIHPPLPTAELGPAEVDGLRQNVHETIGSALKEMAA